VCAALKISTADIFQYIIWALAWKRRKGAFCETHENSWNGWSNCKCLYVTRAFQWECFQIEL